MAFVALKQSDNAPIGDQRFGARPRLATHAGRKVFGNPNLNDTTLWRTPSRRQFAAARRTRPT